MKKIIFLLSMMIWCSVSAHEQNGFTVYLIRHAEKDRSSDYNARDKYRPLSDCGEQQAQYLSNYFKNVSLEKIYSTNYTRTKNTAKPIAQSKSLRVKTYRASDIIDEEKLSKFVERIVGKRKNSLIVGHSNTIGLLAETLAGEKAQSVISENEYNKIYRVVFNGSAVKLEEDQQRFKCVNK